MERPRLLEFTGERVIPGLVDPNLWNEHLARYRFAARFAHKARVLDAGCGSGYGAAELPRAAAVIAMDVSADAVVHARGAFARPGVHFLQAACEALPFADASFDLVLAFEVIEHLERWPQLLADARRILRPSGVLLVSTPNKAWYTESRAEAGANPYHVHEFEYHEFEAALLAFFPHVHLWTQNHSEAITFVPASPSRGQLDAPAASAPEHSHFFLAACSASPIEQTGAFAWLPSAGNVLRERQRHISLLESELAQKSAWLAESREARAGLQQKHDDVIAELHRSNTWAGQLNTELAEARATIASLNDELKTAHAGYRERIGILDAEAAARLEWVADLESQLSRARVEIDRLRLENSDHENTIAERTKWAQSLDLELADARAALQRTRDELSRLEHANVVRFARKLQLVPGKPE
jgi:SAM-dependent methyltransferase